MAEFALSIPQAIDRLYQTRAERLELSRQVKAIQETEMALKQWIIEKLKEDGAEASRGQTATGSITRSREANVQDWSALWEYIYENREESLVQRRVSITSMRERWDSGIIIPGVEVYEMEDLSLTKAATKKVK